MAPDQNRLYLGIKGHVVSIRKEDGKELWRTPLKGSGFTNVVVEPGAFSRSTACTPSRSAPRARTPANALTRCFVWDRALDPDSGTIRWSNDLPRLGFDACTIGSANQTPVALAAIKVAQAKAAASSASHG